MARVDADAYYFIVDRKKDLIIRRRLQRVTPGDRQRNIGDGASALRSLRGGFTGGDGPYAGLAIGLASGLPH